MAFKKRRVINKTAFAKMNADMYSNHYKEQEELRKQKPFEKVIKFSTKTFVKRCLPELAEVKKLVDAKLIGRITSNGIMIDKVFVGAMELTSSLNDSEWSEINKRVQKYLEE